MLMVCPIAEWTRSSQRRAQRKKAVKLERLKASREMKLKGRRRLTLCAGPVRCIL